MCFFCNTEYFLYSQIYFSTLCMIGLHIIADLFDIPSKSLNISKGDMELFVTSIIKESWLQELWSYYHTFGEVNEITWIVALAESHVSFHIWPEKLYMSLDIFVCNLWEDNSHKAEQVFQCFIDKFCPQNYELQRLQRYWNKRP